VARALRRRVTALISFVTLPLAGAWNQRRTPGTRPRRLADTSGQVAPVASATARWSNAPRCAEQAAAHARAALSLINDESSRAHCRALRAVAAAVLALGETAAGIELLEVAISTAVVVQDPFEEAAALADIGLHALRQGHATRAEARLRAALALVPTVGSAHLRATLHHQLALALHVQGKSTDEAERHATTALSLRWDQGSQLAREDRALLALICARRASLRC
jgi:tetratricopeptide (TPR) repeat protein